MLLLGLMYYIMANAVSYRQDSSFRWAIVTILITSLMFGPMLDCFTTTIQYSTIPVFSNALSINQITGYFILIALSVAIAIELIFNKQGSEGYVLFLGLIGTLLLIASNSFAIVLLALELQSFAAYLLVATGSSKNSLIISLNYFFWGCLASAFIVLGLAVVYYYTGIPYIDSCSSELVTGGILMVTIGLAFKVGAAPVHFWTPIVYSQIDNRTISYLALVPKIGALVLMNSLIVWSEFYIVGALVASLSLIIGALGGLKASSFRELMAYSSINHVGFIIILLIMYSNGDNADLLFYISQYCLTLIISLSAVSLGNVNSYNNAVALFNNNKYLFLTLGVSMLSLAGLPPFVGFFSKLIVFQNSITNEYLGLTLIALLSSIVTAYYYLQVIAKTITGTTDQSTAPVHDIDAVSSPLITYLLSSAVFIVSLYALLAI